MRYFKFLIFGLFLTFNLFASTGKIQHEYIVTMKRLYSVEEIYKMHPNCEFKVELLNKDLKIYSFTFKSLYSASEELEFLKSNKNIINSSPNRKLDERSCKPNDPQYNKQWNSSFMGFEDLWCFSNNGITPLGDTIVLGVVDNGCICDIDDISQNLFINKVEIPDNNSDDDNNGYIDDYRGFNADKGEGDNHPIPDNSHGTNVLSIAGAKANNNKQISGAAQIIKMLFCSATNEVSMIKCYTYFIKMKQDYNTFKGQYGAYITVSTTSLGLDKDAFPDAHGAWCDMYDLLGKNGILNFGATTNYDHLIDDQGDIPGLCPSNSLIIVTNTDRSDTRAGTGFSNTHVDLGASGEQVPVIQNDGSISLNSGTSLSTPQVAAGTAYLHQFCERFALLCKTDPEQSVQLMRNFILTGGKRVPELVNETSSGTRFNANGSFKKLLEFCNVLATKNDLRLYSSPTSSVELLYDLQFSQYGPYELVLYNLQGELISNFKSIYTGQVIKGQIFDTKSLRSGLYLLTLKVEDELITRKFVTIH